MGRKRITIYGVDAFIERLKALDMRPIVKIEASFRKGELYIKMFDRVGDEYSGSYVPSEGSYGSKVYKKLMVDYLMGEFGEKKASAKLQETEATLAKTPKLVYDKDALKKWVSRMMGEKNFFDITFDTPSQIVCIEYCPFDKLFADIDKFANISLKDLPSSKAEEFSLMANDNTENIIEVFDKFEIK